VVFLKEYKAFQQMENEAVIQLQVDTEEKLIIALLRRNRKKMLSLSLANDFSS
jgi:hypothetical protein